MKIIVAAFALAIASPAFAQTAPASQPADHSQHQQGQHQGHHQGHHQGMPNGQGHGEGCACCADRNGDGRMDCCENMSQAGQRQPAPAQPQGHQNH